jgi:hypothetical protein
MQTDPTPAVPRRGLRPAAWLGVFVAVTGLLQLSIPGFFDGDTGYHLAIARLTREHGILHAFPWTPFSWLDAHYADKELLFHALLLPLAGLHPTTAARIAGTVLGSLLLLTLFAILRRERVRDAGLWTLAVLACSSAFVARFAMVRPQLISIPLALGITWAAARRNRLVLVLGCALYPLCYTAWHLPVALITLVELARWLGQREVDWRGPVLAATATAAGILVHPNFPHTAELFWIQNANVLFGTAWAGAQGIDLGGEFAPFSLSGLGRYVLLPAVLAVGGVIVGWRARRRDALPLAFALVAVGFLVITLRTQRFIEYLAPFAIAAAALGLAVVKPEAPRGLTRAFAPAVVATGIIWTLLVARHPFELLRNRVDPFPAPVAELLAEIIPTGAQVVTCDWRLTGEMMLALPERRFIVALDPTFFATNDPDRYRLWYETTRRPPAEPGLVLRDAFDARYVLCAEQQQWLGFHRAMERDPAAAVRGDIGLWRVYELRPPQFDPPTDVAASSARLSATTQPKP